jgi:membrane-associated phospholipid phosphatase
MGRVYLERHYVSDIIAGAVIGIVIASTLLRYRRVSLPDGPDLVAES